MKIVAIGGGFIKEKRKKIETLPIDREVVKLSGLKRPRVLFIPTASSDSQSYTEAFKICYGKKLKCKVEVLYLHGVAISKKEIVQKILNTDVIYVGGGNTLMMMNKWKKLGIPALLKKASEKGTVLSGLSAGSICWFQSGNSDSRKFKDKKAKLIRVSGLNLFPLLICPHYDKEKDRKGSLKSMTKKIKEIAIGIDNCAALEINGETYKVVTSKKTANVYKVFWEKGNFYHIPLAKNKNLPLKSLLVK